MKNLYFFLFLFLFSFNALVQSRYISETTKKIVFNRDGGSCQCCGSSQELEYDHIIPYSCGGSSEVKNIQLLCFTCNRSKSNSCYCKEHNKKVGTNCCDKKSSKNSTKNSTKSAIQCTGKTKKGLRCKNKTTYSNGRCYLH